MARRKRMTVGSRYVAIGALTEILRLMVDPELSDDSIMEESPEAVARHIVDRAWDVEHFPVAGKVQITIDLAPLDAPVDQPADAASDAAQ